mmetsp:Transcript_97667/g.260700  ORF Transcript_97667/g.260700 Transcript_97667/m.260700 type:complete len:295 (-) Transcript_97667:269-1153(-)
MTSRKSPRVAGNTKRTMSLDQRLHRLYRTHRCLIRSSPGQRRSSWTTCCLQRRMVSTSSPGWWASAELTTDEWRRKAGAHGSSSAGWASGQWATPPTTQSSGRTCWSKAPPTTRPKPYSTPCETSSAEWRQTLALRRRLGDVRIASCLRNGVGKIHSVSWSTATRGRFANATNRPQPAIFPCPSSRFPRTRMRTTRQRRQRPSARQSLRIGEDKRGADPPYKSRWLVRRLPRRWGCILVTCRLSMRPPRASGVCRLCWCGGLLALSVLLWNSGMDRDLCGLKSMSCSFTGLGLW